MSVDAGEAPPLKFKIDYSEPTKELLEWARDNIQEDPDLKYQHISELLDLIYEKGECTPHRTDDEFLLRFLRARHFIVKKAHRLMVNYYDFRESNPQYFGEINLLNLRELAKTGLFQIPPYTDQFGRRMILCRPGDWNPETQTIPQLFQLLYGMMELAVMEQATQIKGAVVIVDLSDITIKLAWYVSPSYIKHLANITITSFPMRIEAVHFLHSSWIFDAAWSIMKPLLPDIASDIIHFHGEEVQNLLEYVDPKYLPKAYGGIHEDFSAVRWVDEVILQDEKCLELMEELGVVNARATAEMILRGEGEINLN